MSEKCFGQEEFGWSGCQSDGQRRVRILGHLGCDGCIGVLHDRASKDFLTGLPNRYALEDAFTKLRGSNNLLGGIMIDLTKFKKVNDTLGHAAGDKMIQTAADSIRSDDFAARIGGDEFFILVAEHATDKQKRTIDNRDMVELTPKQRLEIVSNRIAAIFVGHKDVKAYNESAGNDDKLQMRLGYAIATPEMSLGELSQEADSKGEVIEPVSVIKAMRGFITRFIP